MHRSERPLLIVQTDVFATSSPALAALSGELDRIFLRALGMAPAEVRVAVVCKGEALPELDEVSAVVITGSTAMVTDGSAWIERTAEWMRQAHARQVPTLGVCFGHQLLAHALGGTVGNTPSGPEYGTVSIEATDGAAGDPLLCTLPKRFEAQSAHYQTVLARPSDATVLARNAYGIHALRFGPRSWGVQFHPEFTHEDLGAILTGARDRLQGLDVDRRLAELRPTPEAASILPRFRALAAQEPQALT